MATPEYFARASVNFPLMQAQTVVVVGAGMVGSQVAEELAKCGIGRLRFIDHDILEPPNLSRHALDSDYLSWNKAEAMTVYLSKHVEGLRAEAVPRKIDETVPDELLDQWLGDADLIVAATDDRRAQRRTGKRALELGIPSLFPGLYVEGGGEVVVQADNQLPCFSCWDEFRDNNTQLRGAVASNFLALPVIYTTVRLAIGILDQTADERRMMNAGQGNPPYMVFGVNRFGTLNSGFNEWRPTCPACSDSRPVAVSATTSEARSGNSPISQIGQPPRSRGATDPLEVIFDLVCAAANLFWVIVALGAWYYFWAEGFNGFRAWWNPVALAPVAGAVVVGFVALLSVLFGEDP